MTPGFKVTKVRAFRPAALAGAGCAVALLVGTQLLPGCGSVAGNIAGRCQPMSSSGHVAALSDGKGKWKIEFGSGSTSEGGGTLDISCSAESQTFEVSFAATVKDSLDLVKSGIALNLECSGPLSRLPNSETNTDSCGVAILKAKVTCPPTGRVSQGSCFAVSGPLFSKEVKVRVDNAVPTPTPTAAATPLVIFITPTAAPTGTF